MESFGRAASRGAFHVKRARSDPGAFHVKR